MWKTHRARRRPRRLMSGVHHFYDFATFHLLVSPVCLYLLPPFLVFLPLVSTPDSRILILLA
jgi:hypothetical protein